MTSQRVERTWIRTGGYGRFRGEWVNITFLIDLVTASKDQTVGVYRMGPPSHGITEYGEIR